MFVVAGVTGNTGSVVAERLLAQGKKVRAIVRREEARKKLEAQGMEVVVVELGDEGALTEALRGAEGAYLLVPPTFGPGILESQAKVARAIGAAVRAAQPGRTVLLSSLGAEHESGTGPIVTCFALEQASHGIPGVTVLRAGYFQENWLNVLDAAKNDGVLPSFLPQGAPHPTVATRDIGEQVAELLTQEAAPPRVVQLAGPAEATSDEAASALGKALGRTVQALYLPTSQARGALQQAGLPEEVAGIYAEMYEAAHSQKLSLHKDLPVLRGRLTLESTLGRAVRASAQ